MQRLSPAQIAKASCATTYEGLMADLLLPIKFQTSSGIPTYTEFQRTGSSTFQEMSTIARPTLLVTGTSVTSATLDSNNLYSNGKGREKEREREKERQLNMIGKS
jgi:hypothetical protein